MYHCVHGFACYFTEINLSELPNHHIYISIKGKNTLHIDAKLLRPLASSNADEPVWVRSDRVFTLMDTILKHCCGLKLQALLQLEMSALTRTTELLHTEPLNKETHPLIEWIRVNFIQNSPDPDTRVAGEVRDVLQKQGEKQTEQATQIHDLAGECGELRKVQTEQATQLAAQEVQIAAHATQIAEQQTQIAAQAKQIADLYGRGQVTSNIPPMSPVLPLPPVLTTDDVDKLFAEKPKADTGNSLDEKKNVNASMCHCYCYCLH